MSKFHLFRRLFPCFMAAAILFLTSCGISVIESMTPAESSQSSVEYSSPSSEKENVSTVSEDDRETSPASQISSQEPAEHKTTSESAQDKAEVSEETTQEDTKAPSSETSEDAPESESASKASESAATSGSLEESTTAEPSQTTTEPTTAEPATPAPTTTEPSTEPSSEPTTANPSPAGPHIAEGPVKNMLRQGLSWVSRSMGYSMEDRAGANGHFDCSGLVAVLLRDGLGENTIGWFGNDPWDTAYWRYFASQYADGNRVQIGNTVFEVRFRESYDYSHAWEIPGSIVVQYPPENDPSAKSGHISLALGTIPYESTQDVIRYLQEEYGVELSGMTGNEGNIPMVYDPNGVGSGHVTWKINANGVAKATCVDNNYCNDPAWIERISAVFVPVDN